MTDDRLSAASGDIETKAADFLQRRRFWPWSEEDQAALDGWLNENVLHRVAFLRLEAGQERIEKLGVLRPRTRGATPPRHWAMSNLLRAVAAFAVCAVLGLGAFHYLSPRQQTYSTAIGGQKILKLADGSRIELNTDTTIRVSTGPRRREIWLDKGEAYFQVAHDETRPFVVNIGAHRVVDLGTKFLIRRGLRETMVSLLEGKARLDVMAKGDVARSVLLTPGKVATVAPGGALSLSEAPSRELNTELSWRRGVLILNRTSLADAAKEFNRYNTGKLVVADPAAAQLTMSGAFPTNDTEAFSDAVKDIFKLHVTRRGADTVITR
jgi:transmembrane sensor